MSLEYILPENPTDDQIGDDYYEHPDSQRMQTEAYAEFRESSESIRMLAESIDEAIRIKIHELIPPPEECPDDILVDRFGENFVGACRKIDEFKASLASKGSDDLTWHQNVHYFAQYLKDQEKNEQYVQFVDGDTSLSARLNIEGPPGKPLTLWLNTPEEQIKVSFYELESGKWVLKVEASDPKEQNSKITLSGLEVNHNKFELFSHIATKLANLKIPETSQDEWKDILLNSANTSGTHAPDTLTSLAPDEH